PETEASLIHASGEAMETAIRAAIADANVEPSQIDLVASGVSGLNVFDGPETGAIRRVLGDGVTIGAPKSFFGETLGAGGAMGMAWALASLERAAGPCTVLITSMGFYGNASAVVMRR